MWQPWGQCLTLPPLRYSPKVTLQSRATWQTTLSDQSRATNHVRPFTWNKHILATSIHLSHSFCNICSLLLCSANSIKDAFIRRTYYSFWVYMWQDSRFYTDEAYMGCDEEFSFNMQAVLKRKDNCRLNQWISAESVTTQVCRVYRAAHADTCRGRRTTKANFRVLCLVHPKHSSERSSSLCMNPSEVFSKIILHGSSHSCSFHEISRGLSQMLRFRFV